MTFIAVVCTGNVCRSPAVELLLRARLARVDVTVRSSGIRARVGNPVDPPMAELLRERGLDPEPFRARVMTGEEVRRSDLVIALTREHRAGVVAADPSAVRRTYLLGELAVLAPAVRAAGWPDLSCGATAARLAALPRLAAAHRGLLRPDNDLEVADPFGRHAGFYAQTLELIVTAVDSLVAAVE